MSLRPHELTSPTKTAQLYRKPSLILYVHRLEGSKREVFEVGVAKRGSMNELAERAVLS